MVTNLSDAAKEASVDIDRDKIVKELARPFVKLFMALIIIFVLNFVVGLLPGFDNTLGETSVTIASLVSGVFTLVAVLLVGNFGRELEPRLKDVMDVTDELAEIATLVKHLIYLVAVTIAYGGLQGVVVPLMGEAWVYELAFLVLALVPTVLIIYDFYRNFEDFTDLATRKITGLLVSEKEAEMKEEDEGGEEDEEA